MRAWSMPGMTMSSTKVPRPVASLTASTRRSERPTVFSSAMSGARPVRGTENGLDGLHVAGAPAQASSQGVAHLRLAGPGHRIEEGLGDERHGRRAVAALDRAAVHQALLDGVEPVGGSEALHG